MTTFIDWSTITMPFTAADVLSNGMSLVGLLAGFVLLGIVFGFAPKIMGSIITAVRGGGAKKA